MESEIDIQNIVEFCALMECNGGIESKSPAYIVEKFSHLKENNGQSLDTMNRFVVDSWKEIWNNA